MLLNSIEYKWWNTRCDQDHWGFLSLKVVRSVDQIHPPTIDTLATGMTKVANSRSGEWQFGGRSRILFSSRTNKRTASVRRRRGNDEAALQVVVSSVCNATQSGSLCFELGWRLMKSIFYFISQVWKLCKTVAAFEVLSLMRLNLVILNILIKLQVCFIFIETKKSQALILKNI